MKTTLLTLKAVIQRTGLSKSTIYSKINAGIFPTNIKVGERRMAFISTEIDAYINALIKQQSSEDIQWLVIELTDQRKTVGDKL